MWKRTVPPSVRITMLILVAFTFFARDVFAQPAEDLPESLRMGRKVAIVDEQGREIRGRIMNVTKEFVTVGKRGESTDVPYAPIVKIDELDDLKNGAAIGLAVGLALFAVEAVLARSDGIELTPLGYVVIGGMYGGLGAGIGTGIDALVGGNRTVYQRGRATARVTIAPRLSPDRGEIRMSLAW